MTIKIGVLALQGNFHAHILALKDLGIDALPIKTAEALNTVDGLIIPGGESTAMLKLMQPENLLEKIKQFHQSGKTLFGTCAGTILLAKKVSPEQKSCQLLSAHITRNAYGRQIDSREATAKVIDASWSQKTLPMTLIRAPKITSIEENVKVIATYQNEPVLIEEERLLACTYHPEMTSDRSVHQYFIKKTQQSRSSS